MKSSFIFVVACALAFSCAHASAFADESASCDIGGSHVLTLRGKNAAARVNLLQERLAVLLRPELKASDVTLGKRGGDFVVSIDGKLFVTLTRADAKACDTPLADYAAQTHRYLADALPQLAPLR